MSYDQRALENAHDEAYLEWHPELVERAIRDGQSRQARSTEPDLIVAERNAFKEKLKSINFGRVPGGARD